MSVVYRERTGMTVKQIVSKWPEKVLAFLWREGFFEESLALCRNYRSRGAYYGTRLIVERSASARRGPSPSHFFGSLLLHIGDTGIGECKYVLRGTN